MLYDRCYINKVQFINQWDGIQGYLLLAERRSILVLGSHLPGVKDRNYKRERAMNASGYSL